MDSYQCVSHLRKNTKKAHPLTNYDTHLYTSGKSLEIITLNANKGMGF